MARARHNRERGNAEPALDLLDRYLLQGRNLTQQQKDRWAGLYKITVLEEGMKRIASRLGAANAPDLAKKYPGIPHRDEFEEILKAIGLEQIKFGTIRDTDFAAAYGIPAPNSTSATTTSGAQTQNSGADGSSAQHTGSTGTNAGTTTSNTGSTGASGGKTNGSTPPSAQGKKVAAVASNDPRAVRRLLKQFAPKGDGREKLVLLLNEARRLDIKETPLAFCFVLRSMFEVSAHVYCDEHGIPTKNPKGYNRNLADLLGEVTSHLTDQNKTMQNELHGALTDLQNKDGLLSVTSLNQLVHSKTFSISATNISIMFGNIFPLLVAMN